MGPGGQATHLPSGLNKQVLPDALRAFPSPASDDVGLDSPHISRRTAGILSPSQWTPSSLAFGAASTVSAEPREVTAPTPILTPAIELSGEPDFNMVVGGALAPVHTFAPTRPQHKAGPGLRLPSFQTLGIAAPHPDRYGQPSLDGATGEPFSGHYGDGFLESLCPAELGDDLRYGVSPRNLPKPGQTLPYHFVATLTPPAQHGDVDWRSLATVTAAGMESPATDPGHSESQPEDARSGVESASTTLPSRIAVEQTSDTDDATWIDGAVNTLLENLRTARTPSNPLRVLSHALPSPSPDGHIFPSIISAIHESTPSSPTVWINVFHAVPGRFNLADLPTSPPNTPGPPIDGEDYFTQKVFDSAVPVSDYQEEVSSLPRSPRPVVPPRSINVSIVERYIPPTSPREFADLTNINGPSILVDRLTELSPNNGSLVFIYPTKAGAETFVKNYLSPVLDPLLRTMCVTHGLSSEIGVLLGKMAAVERLSSHETLLRGVRHLCARLTQRSSTMERFHGKGAQFDVVYATKQDVVLPRDVWAKYWWSKQEKPRVRDVITKYAQEAQKRSSNQYMSRPPTATELIQELLEGVCQRPYQADQAPKGGIEVSVFVIKRTERDGVA